MPSCVPPSLLKWWLQWLNRGLLWRLLGLPAALLAVHLEVNGTSPAATSRIVHRLVRRLRLKKLLCTLNRMERSNNSSIVNGTGSSHSSFFFVGGADVMDRPPAASLHLHSTFHRPHPETKTKPRALTLHRRADKDQPKRLLLSSGAASPASASSPTSTSTSPSSSDSTSAPVAVAVATPSAAPRSLSYSSTPRRHGTSLPPPTPRTLSSNKVPNTPSATRTPMHTHTRSMSHADIVRQGKRLSLQFPIQPATGSPSAGFSPTPRSRPQSWVASPLSPDPLPSPTEANFLAVLAAQERRVLELREELAKAEEDLKSLKKQFVTSEAIRKRNDLRKVQQLQPINTPLANTLPDNDDDSDGTSVWMQREMERRKALLANTKQSHRKVFSGSRHMRTLSLLSPDKTYAPSFPQPPDLRDSAEETPTKRNTISHPPTSMDSVIQNADRYDSLAGLSAIPKDAIIRTGKQMAVDFKDGLLTFIEDIRQATVGDEATGAEGADPQNASKSQTAKKTSPDARPTLNRAASATKKGANDQSEDIGDSFWKEHGLTEPKPARVKSVKKATKPASKPVKSLKKTPSKATDDFEESWDNWDTPNGKAPADSNSSDESDPGDGSSTTQSGRSSARTSTSSAGPVLIDGVSGRNPNRNSIPWPDLVKLSPTNLKRTASHLMKEWEKNLTPPPESRSSTHTTGDYIGRSPTPALP